jgi:hypothetical protein
VQQLVEHASLEKNGTLLTVSVKINTDAGLMIRMYAEEWRLRRTKAGAYSCCEAQPPLGHAS